MPVPMRVSRSDFNDAKARSTAKKAKRAVSAIESALIADALAGHDSKTPGTPEDAPGSLSGPNVAVPLRTLFKPRKPRKAKSKSTAKLENILWDVFSVFIRTRDKRKNNGLCFYCDFRPIDSAMHRIKRGKRATKYDERNCHGGCHSCNFEDNHNPHKFDAIFIRKLGVELFLELEAKSRELCPRTRGGILDKTEYYKRKISMVKQKLMDVPVEREGG